MAHRLLVGYSQNTLRANATLLTPQFIGLGNNGAIDLQDIKCRYDDSDAVTLSTLNALGGMIDTYTWVNYGGDEGDEKCWVDGDYVKAEGVTFGPGEAFWVTGQSEENTIIFPGVELK